MESTTPGLASRLDTIIGRARRSHLSTCEVVSWAGEHIDMFTEDTEQPSFSRLSIPKITSKARPKKSGAGPGSRSTFSARNDVQRRRDFSIGFQGELYVSLACTVLFTVAAHICFSFNKT